MSAIDLVIAARPRDLGGFAVRRVLPAPQRRMIGPFVFLDHMGPATFAAGQGIDVRPHPHVALATVSYLFEGELVHRDSLGVTETIRPGDVNWMTAGKGIVHSERTGPEVRKRGGPVHGLQSWVALPHEHEDCEPTFAHHAASALPSVELPGARLRVVAGRSHGVESPVKVLTPTLYVDVALEQAAELRVPDEHEERAIYVAAGAIACNGDEIREGQLAVLRPGASVVLRASEGSRVMLLGGAPMDGPRHIWWNFVSSSKERIQRAAEAWKNREFPPIPGDDEEYIPLPDGPVAIAPSGS